MKSKEELQQISKMLEDEAINIMVSIIGISYTHSKRLIECIVSKSLIEVSIVQAEAYTKPSKHELALQKIASCPCNSPDHCKNNPTQKCVTCIAREALWN